MPSALTQRCQLENEVIKKELLEWYDYCVEAGGLGFSTINLSSWVKGAPRKSEEELEKVRILQYCKTSLENEIEKIERKNNLPKNAGSSWSSEEDADLIVKFDNGSSIKELSKILERTRRTRTSSGTSPD